MFKLTCTWTNRCNRLISRAYFSTKNSSSETVDFGYREVPREDKQNLVKGVFDSVSSNYDVMNDAMSAGLHRCWKNYFVSKLGLLKARIEVQKDGTHKYLPLQILDVAGGTGDISIRIIEHCREQSQSLAAYHDPALLPIRVTISDINASMLAEGKKRVVEEGYISKSELDSQAQQKFTDWIQDDIQGKSKAVLRFMEANAEQIPQIPDNSLDLYTISFGIRNVTNREKALREAYRMLRPGGRFMCLEFSHVRVPIVSQIYNLYSENVIPLLGQWIAQDRESYQYLVESIRRFPTQEEFLGMIKEGGFKYCFYEELTGGVVAIHSGFKV